MSWRHRIKSTRSFAFGASSGSDRISEDPDEFLRDPLDELLVRRGECIQLVRVDVDLRDGGAVSEDRHDHLRARVDETLEVPRIVVHVGHDYGSLLRNRGRADALPEGNPYVEGRARAGPRSEDKFRSIDVVDPDPRVMRDLAQLPAYEIRNRLALASGVDDLLEASGDFVGADLAFLAGHDLAELPDSLHQSVPLRRTRAATISLADRRAERFRSARRWPRAKTRTGLELVQCSNITGFYETV